MIEFGPGCKSSGDQCLANAVACLQNKYYKSNFPDSLTLAAQVVVDESLEGSEIYEQDETGNSRPVTCAKCGVTALLLSYADENLPVSLHWGSHSQEIS